MERLEPPAAASDGGMACGDDMDRIAPPVRETAPLIRPPEKDSRPPFMLRAVPKVTLLKRLLVLLLKTRLLLTMLIVPLSTRTPFMFQTPVVSSNVVVSPVLSMAPVHVMVVAPVRVTSGTM